MKLVSVCGMVETRRRPFRYMGNDICRELVSSVPKNKRYQLNGHNLDLAYFQEYRLVVMAWPAETLCVRDIKRSKIIRNDAQEVQNCLTEMYPSGFKIYNLCSESQSFRHSTNLDVIQYGWIDHEPPPFALLIMLTNDMISYLAQNRNNGIAVHCKAGKGRTGTSASAFLLAGQYATDTATALEAFGTRRFGGQGVTIASQIRYVKYYQTYLEQGKLYSPKTIVIKKILISFKKSLRESQKDELRKSTFKFAVKKYNSDDREVEKQLVPVLEMKGLTGVVKDEQIVINTNKEVELQGDLKLKITQKNNDLGILKHEKCISTFWINTAFHSGDEIEISSGDFDKKGHRERSNDTVSKVIFQIQVQ